MTEVRYITSGGVATVATIILSIAIIGLVDSGHHTFAAENFMILTGSVVTIYILQRLLWLRCRFRFWRGLPDNPKHLGIANYLLAGMLLMEYGWMFNRGFWFAFRVMNAWGWEAYADHFQFNFQWMSTASLVLVAAGMSIAAGPVLHVRFGHYWPFAAFIFFLTVWTVGYTIPDLRGLGNE